MSEAAAFVCSICAEPSRNICVYCTKDACRNHRCVRCKRCSDCCECDSPLTASETEEVPAVEPVLLPPVETTLNGHAVLPEEPDDDLGMLWAPETKPTE